jgi:hypothetical protein
MNDQVTIFTPKVASENKSVHATKNDSLIISRKEYRDIIKSAYQEGLEDSLKGNKEKKPTEISMGKSEQEGKEKAIQNNATKKEENIQRLKTITERQDIELFHVKSVFPFTLFPDTIIIDTTKISIAKKQLFATEYVTTIPLKDLSDVNLQTFLFLGTITLKYMPQASSPGMNEAVEVPVPNLAREDAIKIKNILKGALVAKAEEIDIALLSPEEIAEVLHRFGESEGVV